MRYKIAFCGFFCALSLKTLSLKMLLSRYKDILGVPNHGFHADRIAGLALNDVLGTIIVSFLIAKLTKSSQVKILLGVFLTGCLLHYIFGVESTINKLFIYQY